MSKREPRLVYSTSTGQNCPRCGHPVRACRCSESSGASAPAPSRGGTVRVSRETKGRKGKGVTLVTGLALDRAALTDLAKRLKKRCGSGGAVKDGVIEIQGDHREALVELLISEGFKAKVAGG